MGIAAAIIILVEDLCQPNLIKAVKKVMRSYASLLVGCSYTFESSNR